MKHSKNIRKHEDMWFCNTKLISHTAFRFFTLQIFISKFEIRETPMDFNSHLP